ncbi:Cysteine protease atg4c [Actinomortierella ambigua]|nr:Cysteine protease atg4c [Actinomortierella ambigua]
MNALSIQTDTRQGTPSSPTSPSSPSRPSLTRSLTHQPHWPASMPESIGITSLLPRPNVSLQEDLFRQQREQIQQQQQQESVPQSMHQQHPPVQPPPLPLPHTQQQQHQQRLSSNSMHINGNIANIKSEPAPTDHGQSPASPHMTPAQVLQPSLLPSLQQQQLAPRPHSISDHSSPRRSHPPTPSPASTTTGPSAAVPALRPPYSSRPNQTVSSLASPSLASPSLAASAFAAIHKVYSSMEDVGFWSSLYTQHYVHTRQSHETNITSNNSNESTEDKRTIDNHGPIKVWQALTKTPPKDPTQQPKFERLPIKVPMSTTASSSSLSDQPFTIVFFFTVESSPATLWFLESAFTYTRTLNEYMELMGTFDPNDADDPSSFYIYETQPLSLAAPTYEDTVLDIHVQSPAGSIYAAYSYTFVKAPTSPQPVASAAIPVSPLNINTNSPSNFHSSPQQSLSAHTENAKSGNPASPRDHQSKTPGSASTSDPFDGLDDDEVLAVIGHDVLEEDALDELEGENSPQEPAGETLPDEPDAGEHFMQATSEFFSKMGYWLYNSRVVQYIAREDRNRTKTVFSTDDIWILGVRYAFNGEHGFAPPEPPRSKKGSIFTSLDIGSKTRRATSLLNSTSYPANSRTPPGSVLSFSISSEDSTINTIKQEPPSSKLQKRSTRPLATPIVSQGLLGSQTGNDSKARSKSQERRFEKEILKEQARALREAKAKEKDQEKERKAAAKAIEKEALEREKEIHKEQKLERLRQRQREKDLEKERRQQQQQQRHGKEIHKAQHTLHHHRHHAQHHLAESVSPSFLPPVPGSPPSFQSPLSSPESRRKPQQLDLYPNSHQPAVNQADPIEKRSQSGLDGREDEKVSRSMMRRMRSMSILPKVSSSIDVLAFKKSPEVTAATITSLAPERTHEPHSKSITNTSFISPRSATSSSASSHSDRASRPSSPRSPGFSMSFHEALAMGPKSSMLSRLSQLNLSSKKLPELPRSVDDIPDFPTYPPLEADKTGSVPTSPTSPVQPAPSSPDSPRRSNRRRMTISGIFARESNADTPSGFANLKTLLSSKASKSKSHLPLAHDLPPLSPRDSKSAGMDSTGRPHHTSATSSISSSSTSSGHSKRGSISKWIEKRTSANDMHHTVFIASTEEPVPPLSKDAAASLSTHGPHSISSPLPRLHSPQSPSFGMSDSHAIHDSAQHSTPPPSPHTIGRRRKKSSIFSVSPSGASPKSVLKHSSSSHLLTAPPYAGSVLNGLSAPTKVNDADIGPQLLLPNSNSTVVSPTPRSTTIHSTLHSVSPQRIQPNNALGIMAPASPGRRSRSLFEKAPASPIEAYVLLDSDTRPVSGGTPRMGHDSMIHMEDSRLSLELLYDDARQDAPSPALDTGSSDQAMVQEDNVPQRPRMSSIAEALNVETSVDLSDLRSDWEALWPSSRAHQEPGPLENSEVAGYVHVQESECKSPRSLSASSSQQHRRALLESKVDDIDEKEVLVEKDDLNGNTTTTTQGVFEEDDEEAILVMPQRLVRGTGVEFRMVATVNQGKDKEHDKDPATVHKPSRLVPTSRDNMRSSTLPPPPSPSPSLLRSFSFVPQQTPPRPNSSNSVAPATAPMSHRSYHTSQELATQSILTEEPSELDGSFVEEPSSNDRKDDETRSLHSARQHTIKHSHHPKADMTFIPPSYAVYLSQFKSGPLDQLTPNQVVLFNFMMDFQSKLWFTYRKDITRIEPSFYTSDAGWGCMMRTGQSLLAQGFLQALLGRHWRATVPQSESTKSVYKMILSWFIDEPERPYSIQNIAKCGLVLDKRVGEWFGPATVAHALLRLSQKHADCPLAIMVPMDGLVRTSEVIQAALASAPASPPASVSSTTHNGSTRSTNQGNELASTAQSQGSSSTSTAATWKPVVILMPMRFGLQKLKEQYTANLKRLFQLPQFLGIAGGRPGRSLYFVANQGDELFYFDPHFVKSRVSGDELNTFPITSFHCTVVRSMELHEIDPSMLLGFVVTSKEDLEDLCMRYEELMDRSYTLVTFVRDTPLSSSAGSSSASSVKAQGGASSQQGGQEHVQRAQQLSQQSRPPSSSTSSSRDGRLASQNTTRSSSRPVDLYEYRYPSHNGDHEHDQDTFSVHSLDTEEDE